ncbi:hypothetical protein GCM10007385_32840 [Tateyamaria omphalii]|uniref:DUF1499 domain-containing protein n=1 Tax=Tateyamaria omphalii TaxID=299262 RepID=UPI001673AD29|nr:DUF1499 domain-containing protein [Tateyamaria omphalii]GGX61002.1 hypothetical protein GCM10007385_32840 [Tateyamaria omphalii]
MHFAAVLPYLIIGIGLTLGQMGWRPAMRVWGMCMIGALSGLAVAITFVSIEQTPSWYLIALSSSPFVIVLIMVIRDLSYPAINDVATDVDSPVMFEAALGVVENAERDMAYPESFKSKVRKAYPFIQPLKMTEPADQVFDRVVQSANCQRGWRKIHQDRVRKTVEVEATTPFLGFVDDVIIQVSEQGGMTRVDMRSKSREGLVDAGKNAKRIEAFLTDLLRGNERYRADDQDKAATLRPTSMQRGAMS